MPKSADTDRILAHWHRLSDMLENIDPESLRRAAEFTRALMQKIDELQGSNIKVIPGPRFWKGE